MADADDDPDSKTEEATPRRLQEAREKGQVAFSSELLAALVLAAWLGAFLYAGGAMFEAFGAAIQAMVLDLGERGRSELELSDVAALLQGFARETFMPALVLIAVSSAVAAFVGYSQVGLAISSKALEADLGKLDPAKGVKKLFGVRAMLRTGLSLAKTLLIVGVTAFTAWLQIEDIVALGAQELGPALAGLGRIALKSLSAALAAIVAIGLFDLFMQRRQFHQELRMSKQEIKEEARQSDGDPHVKARIRRVQREMAQRRMMAEVPTATVVITNPTHYAVALRYDREAPAERRGAPRVVAKGVDHVAQRIKELAREAGVVLYENRPLARTLHARCEIGDEVPAELYQAVAEVLAYVFEVQSKSRGGRAQPVG